MTTLTPRLIVRDADRAIDFYQRALGAQLEERYTDDQGRVVHAGLTIGGVAVALAEERREWNNDAPPSLGGSPVILSLVVDDVDAAAERLRGAGAEVVFPVADQHYGRRDGRFRDPFGHLWIIGAIVAEVDPAEVQRRTAGD